MTATKPEAVILLRTSIFTIAIEFGTSLSAAIIRVISRRSANAIPPGERRSSKVNDPAGKAARMLGMTPITLKAAETCRWDCVSLGEVMLRLDPGEERIHTARNFRAWEGGGEYNVARGLRRCFGMRTAVITAFAKNPIGQLLEDLILQGGVDTSLIRWVPYDGIGRTVRNGLNFTERGFGVRAAVGCSDRGNTAISQAKTGDFDWEAILGPRNGSRWFHTGGIFAALSPSTPEVAVEALDTARKYGTVTSFDLNYRDSLWKSIGGKAKAQEVNRELVKKLDVLFGNEEDFSAMLGIKLEGVKED